MLPTLLVNTFSFPFTYTLPSLQGSISTCLHTNQNLTHMSSQREGSCVAMKLAKTLFFASLSILVFFTILTTSADTISPTQSIKDGETLVSPKEEYELGFFKPGTSTNKYLGIWYKKISTPTIVWVANRNFPITDSSGVLKFGTDGILVVVNGSAGIVWSSNVSKAVNPIAQIMDNGNFVIREQGNLDPEQYLWQSFDYPTDTLIPGMKVGWDLKKGLGRYLTSWKNQNDPSLGDYTYGIDLHGIPQGYVYKKNVTILRTGSWNGAQFAGVPGILQNYIFNFSFTINRDEVSYTFYVKNDSYYSRLVLNYSTGQLQRHTWLSANKVWNMFWYIPNDDCDTYMQCGVYGVCNGDHEISGYPICNCIKGFEPKNGQDWYLREWSGGCVLKTKYECQKTDGFLLMKNLKIPDTSQASVNENWNLDRCRVECRRNCSCKAYATYNVTNGGSGCIIWIDDLRDLRKYADGGQDLYVRVAASEVETSVLPREIVSGKGKKKLAKTIIIISAVSATFILGFSVCFIWRKRMFKNIQVERLVSKAKNQDPPLCEVFVHGKRDYYGEKGDIELNLFDMDTIVRATDNFDNTNLLGQGGFGCVYKGTWDNGQVVAVKRLSKNSGQGAEEFKNEVILIARLQHRNLVRLLGGCVEGEEKMLVYEYMENKGLDSILFNKEYSFLLDWPKRFNIIVGISRGLLYLHQDSRFRIVHRDLKASNVLLDGEMHPKISDFGMARIFGGDDTEAKTKRVVGTYGYMSPEYAMDGLFSVKSDVFSFGVLVLEIISGRRNKGFFCSDDQLNLLGHAWSLWNEGHALEVIDEAMEDTCLPNEALRCIQVGLLCVQERAEDRPTMSSVVLMLSSDSATLPQPKQPGFCFTKSPIDTDSTSTKQESVNKVTVTMLQPR